MDLDSLYTGSFVNWEAVAGSWSKRTISSRLLLMAARRYLSEADSREPEQGRREMIEDSPLPDEVKRAFSSPPDSSSPDPETSDLWGKFVDAAVAAELEIVSYGERPPLLHELRNGLENAAKEAGEKTDLGRWFLARRAALPGDDLPDDAGYFPV